MSKKIYLQITPFFPSDEHFVGSYIYDQVKAIGRNSDYDVVVIKVVPFYKKAETTYTYQGIDVHQFKVIDLPSAILPGLFQTINLMRLEKFLKRVVGVSPKEIAFVHGHVAYPAGRLAVDFGQKYGIGKFVQHHGLDVMQLTNGRVLKGKLKLLNDRFVKKSFLRTVNHADINIGVSQKVLEQLHAIKGYSHTKEYVLYNGVDTNKFFPTKKRNKRNKFTIGCIGNFWKIKDQITLLKAIDILVNHKKIIDLEVIFVGSGPYLSMCRDFVTERKLQSFVTFEQEIDHSLLNDFYNDLDLFVLPSYYEALGCVYMEALQVGIPIIAVEGQGIEEVLDEEEKEHALIPKGDYGKLAEKIVWHMSSTSQKSHDLSIDKFIQKFMVKL